jgi:hypothetical protein
MTNASALRLAFFGFVALGAMAAGSAARGANSTGTARVVTISPLGIARTADMDFGYIIPSATAGTVTVNAQTAARTSTGGVTLSGGPVSTANFLGAANAGSVVTLSLTPSPNLTLSRIGGGATMIINQIRVSKDGAAPTPLGPNATIASNGAIFLRFGGRLNVGANQMEGVYAATLTLTMNYQ